MIDYAVTLDAKVAAAIAAQEAGDYTSALTYLRSAVILLNAIPDSKKGELELRWDRRGLDLMIKDVKTAAAATVAGTTRTIGQIAVTYKRAGA